MSNCCNDSVPYTRATLAPAVAAPTPVIPPTPVEPPTIVEDSSFTWTSLVNDTASGGGSIWRESATNLNSWPYASAGVSGKKLPVDQDSAFEFKLSLAVAYPALSVYPVRVGLVQTNDEDPGDMGPYMLEFLGGNVYVDGSSTSATTGNSGDWFRMLHNYTDLTVTYQKKNSLGQYETFATSTTFTRGHDLYADFSTQGAQHGIVGAKYIYGGSFEFSAGTSTSSNSALTSGGTLNAANYADLQAAVDALTETNPILEIPGGTYIVSSSATTGSGLSIHKPFKVTLVGKGASTILKHDNTLSTGSGLGAPMIWAYTDLEIRDLTLDGDTVTNAASNVNKDADFARKSLLYASGWESLVCRNVTFQDFFGGISGFGNLEVDGCIFKGIASNNGGNPAFSEYTAAIRFFPYDINSNTPPNYSNNNHYNNFLTVVDSTFSATADLSIPTEAVLKTGDSPFGIIVSQNGSEQYERATISRNRFLGLMHPVDTYDGVQETIISDNHIKGFAYAGFKVQRSEGVIISGNTIEDGYRPTGSAAGSDCSAIALAADARYSSLGGEGSNVGAVITSNVIKNVERRGILVQQTYVTISSNVIDTIVTDGWAHGISIDAGQSGWLTQNTVVVGNVIKNCATPFTSSGPDVVRAGNSFDTILGYGPGGAGSVFIIHSAGLHTNGYDLTIPDDKNWVSLIQTDANLWQSNATTGEPDPVPIKNIFGGSVGQRVVLQKGNDTADIGGQALDTPPITLLAGAGNIRIPSGLSEVRLTNSSDTIELIKGTNTWYLASNATQKNWVRPSDLDQFSQTVDLSGTQTIADLATIENKGQIYIVPSTTNAQNPDIITTLPSTYGEGARITLRKAGTAGTFTFTEPNWTTTVIPEGDPNIFFPQGLEGRQEIPQLWDNSQAVTFIYSKSTNRWTLDNVNFEGGTDDYLTEFKFTGQNDFLTPLDGWTFVNMDPEPGVTLQTVNSLGSTRFNGREITFRGPYKPTGAVVVFNDYRKQGVIPTGATGADYAGRLILPTAGQSIRLTNSGELATFVSYQYTFNVGAANEYTKIGWYLKHTTTVPRFPVIDSEFFITSTATSALQLEEQDEWIQLGWSGSVTSHTFDRLGIMDDNGHEVTFQGPTSGTVTFEDWQVNNVTFGGPLALPTTNLVLDSGTKIVTFRYNHDGVWHLKSKNF